MLRGLLSAFFLAMPIVQADGYYRTLEGDLVQVMTHDVQGSLASSVVVVETREGRVASVAVNQYARLELAGRTFEFDGADFRQWDEDAGEFKGLGDPVYGGGPGVPAYKWTPPPPGDTWNKQPYKHIDCTMEEVIQRVDLDWPPDTSARPDRVDRFRFKEGEPMEVLLPRFHLEENSSASIGMYPGPGGLYPDPPPNIGTALPPEIRTSRPAKHK